MPPRRQKRPFPSHSLLRIQRLPPSNSAARWSSAAMVSRALSLSALATASGSWSTLTLLRPSNGIAFPGSLDVVSFSRTGPAGQAAVTGGGHGNVAGISDVFYQVRGALPAYRADNEQRMALAVVAFARAKPREIPPLIVVTASHAGVCLRKLAMCGGANWAEAHGVWLHVWHVVTNIVPAVLPPLL